MSFVDLVLNRKINDFFFFFNFWLAHTLICLVSYASNAAALNYAAAAAAHKLVAVPSYTQTAASAYRPVIASPTPTTSAYTTAYIQPTGISPIKVNFETKNWKSLFISNLL